MKQIQISFDNPEITRSLLGTHNAYLKQLAESTGINAYSRGSQVTLEGSYEKINLAKIALTQLYELVRLGYPIYEMDIDYTLKILATDENANLKKIFLDQIYLTNNKHIISPRTLTQKKYLEAMRNYDIVFSIGPAGTGKTYLAMAMAIDILVKKKVDRIVLVRPAVEAGEKLGFLPGDLLEKINPYLRPLYDALHDIINFDKANHLLGKGIIEIAPLAFMRGRTLNSSFIILDEAQNATNEQMKMFLTRLGINSKAVITGDITQIDLPLNTRSGLIEAQRILAGITDIIFIKFSEEDVVRHKLVRKIIKAYEQEII